jgi:hypothetical protein
MEALSALGGERHPKNTSTPQGCTQHNRRPTSVFVQFLAKKINSLMYY